MKTYEIAVIGGGPAGMTACIRLRGQGLNPLLIEKDKLGGSLLNANLVENYPGFPEGIEGKHLVELIVAQFNKYSVETLFSEVKHISKNKGVFKIELDNGAIYSGSVIVATGAVPKKLGLENEERLYESKRLFYEIKELPPNIKGRFTIIGSGDAAFDYALNLSRNGNKVTILHKDKLRCLPLLIKRVKKDNNINTKRNKSIIEIKQCNGFMKIICDDGIIDSDYVMVAVGRDCNVKLLDENIKKEDNLFIIGDANNGRYRQLVIAISDAMKIAMRFGEKKSK